MIDRDWLGAALKAARPAVVGALLRYFRDLDAAEEAFNEACLRATRNWPGNGPPRDVASWLIMVGRNFGLDQARRRKREGELPDDYEASDGSREDDVLEALQEADYRDDILRLMFVCCHPDLPATQQVALALRIVAGLSVAQIARAFLVGESAMEQRITRAKKKVGSAGIPFETPSALDRNERLGSVCAMLYLVFNQGYSAPHDAGSPPGSLCVEAIRLTRMLLRLFPGQAELMGLLALMLLQHARLPARFDATGSAITLDEQDRSRWDARLIGEGLALVDKGMHHGGQGPFLIQAAVAALHARAATASTTDWAQIELLYASLERLEPSPVVTLNRAVALAKAKDAQAGLDLADSVAQPLASYFYLHGVRGALLRQLGRNEEARTAFGKAIGLAGSAAEAVHIRRQLDQLAAG